MAVSLPATQAQLHTSHATEFRYMPPGCSGIVPHSSSSGSGR